MKNIIYFTIILLLSSCNVYRSFETPENIQPNIAGNDISIIDTLIELPSWESYFTDEKLQILINEALSANSDLLIAKQNIVQAEAALLSSKLSYLPSFALAPQGGISKFGDASLKTYNLPLTTQWEIDLSGRMLNEKRRSQSLLLQSEEYTRLIQTQLISSVANSYYTLVMLDEQLRITISSCEIREKTVEIMKSLKDVGLQTEAAVNQAEVDYYNVKASVNMLEYQIVQVQNALSLLLNQTPQDIQRATISNVKFPDTSIVDKISLAALSNRPDVKVAEAELSSCFYGVNIARSTFYPSLNLSGSVGWTNNLGEIINPANFLLSALGSLTQPLFNKGANLAGLKISQSQYEQSLIRFEKSLLIAGNEVNTALTDYQKSAERIELRTKQVNSAMKGVENTMEIMKYSSISYLEVLTAQSSLLDSQLLAISDWFSYMQSNINIYKSIGGM